MTEPLFIQLEKFKSVLAALQPIAEDRLANLHKKMRLEWNYNSNHIEGNTLTYGETELLLIFGETKGGHEFREYEEMKGHDVALKMVEDLANDKERELTESFICNLNKLILKEPFYKEAITPDGQATRRLIKIGEYKSQPNSVRLQNGEMFHYTSPAETPAKMHDLLQWYRQAAVHGSYHPVTLAAELHYRFVLIHPFDDGNGRISRLLMNYHLLRQGYPPVIIISADKKNYLRALHEADTGNVAAFVDYVAEQLLWSYEISIKAAKGESVDEVGDWEKKLTLLEKEVEKNDHFQEKYSIATAERILDRIVNQLVEIFKVKLAKYNDMFLSNAIYFKSNSASGESNWSILPKFKRAFILNHRESSLIRFKYAATEFKRNGVKTFNVEYYARIEFDTYQYKLDFYHFTDDVNKGTALSICTDYTASKYYHQSITDAELDTILNVIVNYLIAEIKAKTD